MNDYIARFRPWADGEMRWFASQPDLETVVELAAMCRTSNNKRHPHQRRLPVSALQAARDQLLKADLTSCESFEQLHDRIAEAIGPLHNIGRLTVYDIASRIGAFLRLEPERVYLHRGTREGARAIGFTGDQETLEVDQLPSAFHVLKPGEIEDCLCIYKKALRRIHDSMTSTGSGS